VSIFCLSFHAGYRCLHSGACCTSGWAIPVEPALRARLDSALADGTLRPAGSPFVEGEFLADGASILRIAPGGACSCYDASARRCRIHAQLGHDALPAACQHFPRVCLLERDGTFVTLSHYCPTAARMLLSGTADTGLKSGATPGAPLVEPARIVEAPAEFAPMPLEGLDAREALPPLLRPRMLADRDSYRLFERRAIAVLSESSSAEAGLARIGEATETVRRWEPRDGPLSQAIEAAFETGAGEPGGGGAPFISPRVLSLDTLVRECVPAGLRVEPRPPETERSFRELVAPAWPAFAPAVRRYVAARLFANWCSYQGEGFRTVVESVRAALSVLYVEASRQCATARRVLDASSLLEALRSSDLLLVHLASREELARRLGRTEALPRVPSLGP
jgi:Fe-S-cluster containining protein